MQNTPSITLAAALLAAAAPASAADLTGMHYGMTGKAQSRLALTPIEAPLFYPADHPLARKACQFAEPGGACPLVLRSNDGGHVPTIPPVLTSGPADDLLITFTHHQTFITPLTGESFQPDFHLSQGYTIDSPAADWESPIQYTSFTEGIGSISAPIVWELVVWQAVVVGGCAVPTGPVPINFEHTLGWSPGGSGGDSQRVAEFTATDDDTLNGTGFWNYQFAVEGSHADGSSALFDVRGTVSATCSAGIPD